uniref:Uncharacterized protein n=1 Tax=Anguilla anguilla TaxID=7936 RepID=A0A0E9WRS9_ANGAN
MFNLEYCTEAARNPCNSPHCGTFLCVCVCVCVRVCVRCAYVHDGFNPSDELFDWSQVRTPCIQDYAVLTD